MSDSSSLPPYESLGYPETVFLQAITSSSTLPAYESLEYPKTSSPEIVWPSNNKERTSPAGKKACLWITVALMLLGAIAGGVYGGIRSHKKHTSNTTSSTSVPSQTPDPIPWGWHLNSSTTLLENTAIATATCANGDRWLFSQRMTGSIYGSHHLMSDGKWINDNYDLNFTVPMNYTSLGASCIYITPSLHKHIPLEIGDYISLVYLDTSHHIQQSVQENGTWRNSPITPPIHPPAMDTKLSVSTVVIPELPGDNGAFHVPSVSSVLTYVTTNSSMTTTTLLDPETMKYSNTGLPSTFPLIPVELTGAGLGCLVNIFVSNASDGVNLYSRFVTGANGPFENRSRGIQNHNYYYNGSMIGKAMTAASDLHVYDYPTYNGTEIALLQISDNAIAEVYFRTTYILGWELQRPAISIKSLDYETGNFSEIRIRENKHVPLYSRISATSLPGNSSTVYMYFQVDETIIMESPYDLRLGFWNLYVDARVVTGGEAAEETGEETDE